AKRRLRGTLGLALSSGLFIIQGSKLALRESGSPGIFRMHARQPVAPVGQLQCDGNIAWAEIAVGAKNVCSNLAKELTQVGNNGGWIGVSAVRVSAILFQ